GGRWSGGGAGPPPAEKALTLPIFWPQTADKGAGSGDVLSGQQRLLGLVVPFVILTKPVHCLEITQRVPGRRSPYADDIAREITQIVQLRLYPQCIGRVRRISLRLMR